MNLERLRWGEWIAAIAALDLLLVTFRGWYKVSGGSGHVTAWDALSQGRYLLIATAVVGIFLWLLQASEDSTRLSFPPGWIAAAIGLACTVYIAYRLATPPVDSYDPDLGLYLGLVSALGVAIGGLMSAREPETVARTRTASDVAQDTFTGPSGSPEQPLGALVPDSSGTGTWSPAAPAPSSTGWSPTGASAPALAAGAGAAASERALQPGDHVTLTTGGARFPAGTVAEVVEVFRGGALVEVKAADGMAERFEVPEAAFERGGAGAGAAGAAAAPPLESTSPSSDAPSWEPAMPAPAGNDDDWGFDEEPAAQEPQPEKVPWWKREIGGGKKKGETAAATAAVASAAGIVAADQADQADEHTNGNGEGKPSFFKRIFGGGSKPPAEEETTEVPEAEPTPAVATAGMGEAAESDTAVHETAPESVVDDAPAAVAEPEPTATDAEPAATVAEPAATEPEPIAAPPEPEPEAVAPAEAPAAAEAEPAAVEEPEVAASREPEVVIDSPSAADPDTPAAAAEPEVAAAREPEVVIDSPSAADADEPAAASEPVAAPPEPEPEASEPQVAETPPEPVVEDTAAAAAPTAAMPEADEPGAEEPKPKRKRSSGSRKVPKEVLVTADEPQPKAGDEVQLKVAGGRFDAGTRGTVVDVFSAGVIVELSHPDGRTERLDLPFEAVEPAEA